MKLTEAEGEKLFSRYGIAIPKGTIVGNIKKNILIAPPCVIKAQVLSGNRRKEGGIFFARDKNMLEKSIAKLLEKTMNGELIKEVLIEEKITAIKEYYIGISYDTDTRSPVLSLSPNGGSGVARAKTFPIDITLGMPPFFLRASLNKANFPTSDVGHIIPIIQNLWELFIKESALLAEINPLFKTRNSEYIAGDAKIMLDDEKVKPGERRFIEMQGDIAILASGGGASLLNIDALLQYGGKPANYTEYSGNPPAHIVKELTKRVLSKKGLKGCWVVGGTANFTDIYETMRGFIEGLREVKPKPTYPIVIRRDGPRQKEAFLMLNEVAKKEGYQFYLFGGETAMAQTAKIMVKLAYGR
ncbi:MAG: hypothetical protein HY001_04690 [Candidatus Portnoybacteria bacterium]|nr:hypothetical protein [Candidatus Portnoybacteria bacterium]